MDCPIDSTQLVMSERQGVEIDYCPKCRGVWLDRGELDKILDRVTRLDESPPEPRDEDRRREPRYEEGRGSTHHGDPAHRKKKRKSFLEDVFEFGG